MADQTTSGNTVPAFLTKAEIKGNEDGEVSLAGGFVQLYYHESILQDSVRADYIFADSGNTLWWEICYGRTSYSRYRRFYSIICR